MVIQWMAYHFTNSFLIIQSKEVTEEEDRDHVDEYLDKVTDEQSKYIALHVGIFWGIGRFVIQNEDSSTSIGVFSTHYSWKR